MIDNLDYSCGETRNINFRRDSVGGRYGTTTGDAQLDLEVTNCVGVGGSQCRGDAALVLPPENDCQPLSKASDQSVPSRCCFGAGRVGKVGQIGKSAQLERQLLRQGDAQKSIEPFSPNASTLDGLTEKTANPQVAYLLDIAKAEALDKKGDNQNRVELLQRHVA